MLDTRQGNYRAAILTAQDMRRLSHQDRGQPRETEKPEILWEQPKNEVKS